MKDLVVVLLAGGKSDRFWPLNNKNLLHFTDGNLLEYHIKNLSKFGVKDFIVVCSAEVAAFLRVNLKEFANLNIEKVLQNGENRGIGNAVLLAYPTYTSKFKGKPVYIINCDDVYNPSIHEKIYTAFKQKSPDAIVGAYKITSYLPLGYFKIDKEQVKGIVEKPAADNKPSDYANMSLHLYRSFSLIVDTIVSEKSVDDTNDDLYERSLDFICQKRKVLYEVYDGGWEILKYPWNTLTVMKFFLNSLENKISDKAIIDKSAKITGPVIIEEGVKILEFARVVGPAVIKKNSIVGTGSLIRESIVGQGCIVGYNTEITRSYVGSNCWFHTNYVGDSVLGNNVTMGAGSLFANLRLDQKTIPSVVKEVKVDSGLTKFGAVVGNSVSIGVQASIMPGVKIGKNSVIGPMVFLNEDVAEQSKVMVEQKLHTTTANTSVNESSRKQFRKLLKV